MVYQREQSVVARGPYRLQAGVGQSSGIRPLTPDSLPIAVLSSLLEDTSMTTLEGGEGSCTPTGWRLGADRISTKVGVSGPVPRSCCLNASSVISKYRSKKGTPP